MDLPNWIVEGVSRKVQSLVIIGHLEPNTGDGVEGVVESEKRAI